MNSNRIALKFVLQPLIPLKQMDYVKVDYSRSFIDLDKVHLHAGLKSIVSRLTTTPKPYLNF